MIKYKNTAFWADENGIHNTFVFVMLFAFVITCPIRFIPWSAVSYLDRDEKQLYLRVKTKEVQASVLGKLVLKAMGYNFSAGFTKGDLTEGEKDKIEKYCHINRTI